jgi:putative tryptophan/tyrosine transport system substrate-binding protein
MDRRGFIGAVIGGLLAAPLGAKAQRAGTPHRIGVLEVLEAGSNVANLNAFRERLRELGYVEGQNLVIEYRSADSRPERFADLAIELVQLKTEVIVTNGDAAASAARRATRTTPIVMASSFDPVGAGVVVSLARPAGNVTGFHFWASPKLGGQRLELLKELVPSVSRVAVLWNSGNIYSHLVVKETEMIASALGIQLQRLDVNRSWDLERAFEAAMLGQVDALMTVDDYLTVTDRVRIVEFAAMSRLPAIYGLREFVDAGGLIAYGTDRRDLFHRSATYVHRILRGTRPADLPVEPPTKFELVINLKTAKALDLTIPKSVLVRADELVG